MSQFPSGPRGRGPVLRLLALAAAGLFLAGCRPGPPPRVTETAFLLGTVLNVTIQQHGVPRDAIGRVFARVQEIQDRMSANEANYDDTEVLRVNRAAGIRPVEVSAETLFVVQEAIRFGAITCGAFDLTIGPLIKLWGMGTEEAAVPPESEIQQVLERVRFQKVVVGADARTVYLPEPGMGIDLGGIAKGYSADEATRVLREMGVRHAILDFGGDVATIGRRADDTPWRVGIQHPSGERGRFIGILQSVDESVVSSGAYERYFFEDGVRYHHIFDPATGYPSDLGLTSVTVIGPLAVKTDALSTAVFVMGAERGLALIDSLPGYEAIISTEDGRLFVTGDLPDRFEVRSEEFRLITDADR